MSKHLELAKKIKALCDNGVDGEKENAEILLKTFLKKHNISLDDLEKESENDYFFKVKKSDIRLFQQICKRVNYDLKIYSVPLHVVNANKLVGNVLITCTTFEFVEISSMFGHYKKLYESELEVFYKAFLMANDLLATPPKDKMLSTKDLSEKELSDLKRQANMSASIKSERPTKKLENNKKSN